MLPMSAPDQVLVSGLLADGAPVSIHCRGGASETHRLIAAIEAAAETGRRIRASL